MLLNFKKFITTILSFSLLGTITSNNTFSQYLLSTQSYEELVENFCILKNMKKIYHSFLCNTEIFNDVLINKSDFENFDLNNYESNGKYECTAVLCHGLYNFLNYDMCLEISEKNAKELLKNYAMLYNSDMADCILAKKSEITEFNSLLEKIVPIQAYFDEYNFYEYPTFESWKVKQQDDDNFILRSLQTIPSKNLKKKFISNTKQFIAKRQKTPTIKIQN